ncbi:MAG: UspA domain-containing protein [Deltaproteobacteria bacterium CSP1-8]|nr:MAG: UspA domain-containing protein [candidate division NC10 bacterium CSP1-5]KRT72127.1 MAG: UspA domain-containing protein [Deltaproteobacteria bacterium CSP1-8]
MFKNLLIAMDLSYASMCLLRCVGPLRTAGAESATLIHVMNVRDVGGLYISMKNLVEPLLKDKEKQLVLLIPITILEGEKGEKKCEVLCGDIFRHPLFATDYSEPAERAFHYLEHVVAHTHPPEGTLFHVQDPVRIQPHLAHRLDEFNRIDRERLDALEVRLKEWGASVVNKEVEFGRPGPLIVEKIRKGSYSILVIGGQGRGYMAEAFLGRVANHVVHRSAIPVLVVPGHP